MFKWLEKRRKKHINDVANAVIDALESRRGWHKFLPPVALHDAIYMVTEDGTIFRMSVNYDGFEVITKIHGR